MTHEQIEAWAKAGESETLEFKKTTGERKEASQSLCAMLNHRGGRVLFGVDPSRVVRGQQVVDKTLEDVAQEIKEIDPPVFPTIERVVVATGREVLVVSVTQGQGRPYSYKGRAYKRVGNTSLLMSREEYNRMLLERLHGDVRWENQVAEGWTAGDLDATEIVRTVEEGIRRGRMEDPGNREPADLLRGLSLRKGNEILKAAVVLFGRSSRLEQDMPQCLLRVARFRGNDKTEFIDNRQFHGNAFRLLSLADRFLRENLPVAGRIVPSLFEREDDPLYPPVALREALANALCHRDYSIGGGSVAVGVYDNRLDITSSGTLHFGLTVDQLYGPHESLPWNPLIAWVFYRRGIIEAWGRGTLKIMELSEKAGLERPEIEEAGGCVTVRFRPSRYIPPSRVRHDLSARQRRILGLLADRSLMALREIRQHFGAKVEEWAIKDDLALLKGLGLVANKGHGRGAYWYLKEQSEE
jgi:ATP-dependent DNA helicase RecG